LLFFAQNGGNIFISANYLGKELTDTLHFKTSELAFEEKTLWRDTVNLNFANPRLKTPSNYCFTKSVYGALFSSLDTLNTTILGTCQAKYANFVKIKLGDGAFFVHTEPVVFTNYYLVDKQKYDYAFRALSYLPKTATLWDEYYKPNKTESDTPLRYILSDAPLKAAYYLLITGIVLFMIFEAKRRQRIIPIIKPHRNTSKEFAETVARLYLHNRNHKDIATKRFKYFLEHIRSKYFMIFNNQFDEKQYELIASKAGVNLELVKSIFENYHLIEAKDGIDEATLNQFNTLIENFYKAGRH